MAIEKEHRLRIYFCIVCFLCFTSSLAQETVSMKDYVDKQIQMLERMNSLRDEHQREISRIKDEHIKTAYAAQDKRLDGMNEFRDALKDSNATYVTWQALIGLIIGVSGFVFGFANYKKNQESSSGKNIVSGDKVEVKK